MNRRGPVFSYDVSFPLDSMDAYVTGTLRALSASFGQHRCYVFGPVADGNLHFGTDSKSMSPMKLPTALSTILCAHASPGFEDALQDALREPEHQRTHNRRKEAVD